MVVKQSAEPQANNLERRRRLLRRLAQRKGAAPIIDAYTLATYDLQLVSVDIAIANWPAGAPPMKIGFLTDLHCDRRQAVIKTSHAAHMVMEQKPDVVLLGGDFVSEAANPWAAQCAKALAPVSRAPLGTYGVLGNHDYYSHGRQKLEQAFAAAGLRLLFNQSVPLLQAWDIWLVGLDDFYFHKSNAQEALSGIPDKAVRILLVHEPDAADLVPGDYAVQFSGHSHAGQVRLLGQAFVLPVYGRRYPRGLQRAQRHLVYTSRGIGVTGVPFRICCRPEVTVATLHG